MMLQVNGGSIEEKVDYAYSLFEKPVKVTDLFEQDEMIDTIAITKGRGTEGVVTRWGVSRLPRKTHRGLRKVSISVASPPSDPVAEISCLKCNWQSMVINKQLPEAALYMQTHADLQPDSLSTCMLLALRLC